MIRVCKIKDAFVDKETYLNLNYKHNLNLKKNKGKLVVDWHNIYNSDLNQQIRTYVVAY